MPGVDIPLSNRQPTLGTQGAKLITCLDDGSITGAGGCLLQASHWRARVGRKVNVLRRSSHGRVTAETVHLISAVSDVIPIGAVLRLIDDTRQERCVGRLSH